MAAIYETTDHLESYFQKCVENMHKKIKDNKLTEEFLNISFDGTEFKKNGFMFHTKPVITKIDRLTDSDGHSGASFACCCHNVYAILKKEKKQQMRSRFIGVIKAIIHFKRLRDRALERYYAPGGGGFLIAQEEFTSIQQEQ